MELSPIFLTALRYQKDAYMSVVLFLGPSLAQLNGTYPRQEESETHGKKKGFQPYITQRIFPWENMLCEHSQCGF